MNIWDGICGRKDVQTMYSEGLQGANGLIGNFKDRTFLVRGGGLGYTVLDYSGIYGFLNSLPPQYVFRCQSKTFSNRAGIQNARILIKGSVGLCGQFNRYNPLDLTYLILTSSSGIKDKVES
jgi:hypothetical protein